MLTQDLKGGHMHRKAAEFLMDLGIWVLDEVCPPQVNLKKKNARRFETRYIFWREFLVRSKLMTADRAKNKTAIEGVLLNLGWYSLGSGDEGGIAFNTAWYRQNRRVAFSFFQVLEDQRVVKLPSSYAWVSIQVGQCTRFKVFTLKKEVSNGSE